MGRVWLYVWGPDITNRMDTPCIRVREWNPSHINGFWVSSLFPKSLLSTDGAVGTIWTEEHPYLNSHWRNTWPVSGKILGSGRVASADCEAQVFPAPHWQEPVSDRLPHWAPSEAPRWSSRTVGTAANSFCWGQGEGLGTQPMIHRR